jgi:hypothetical protein
MGGAEDETQRIADLEKEIAKRNRWIDQRDRRIDKLKQELAATLNKECGVSYERIGRLLKAMFGLHANRSSLNRAVLRLAGIVQPLSEKIGRRVQAGPMLSPDETGWKVGGHRAWLHVAATREDSYYMITRGRGTREATALIGIDYSGTIVRDGHPSYRVFTKANSQTCLAHLLRRIEGLLEIYKGYECESWLHSMKRVLKRSVSVSQRRDDAQIGGHGLMVVDRKGGSGSRSLARECSS